MEAARHMIAEEVMEIQQAVELTGCPDLAYFYRVFKKVFGVAPGQLLQRCRYQSSAIGDVNFDKGHTVQSGL